MVIGAAIDEGQTLPFHEGDGSLAETTYIQRNRTRCKRADRLVWLNKRANDYCSNPDTNEPCQNRPEPGETLPSREEVIVNDRREPHYDQHGRTPEKPGHNHIHEKGER